MYDRLADRAPCSGAANRLASNLGQFSAWCRFVRAALRSNDRDYRKIAIEYRGSNARQSNAGLSHEFQKRRRTGINAVSAKSARRSHGVAGQAAAETLAALQSDQTPPGCFRNGFSA